MARAKTMKHPETGATLKRARRVETVSYMGMSKQVEIEGWFPDDNSDGILIGDDSLPLDSALAELKADYVEQAKTLAKKVRASTGLTQKDASLLLTGSPNSFSKYERGVAQPSWPTYLLLKLLDRQPKLIETIKTV
ncbi:MAG: type II TA system antitoxin MqsA family protein [Hyphomicrobiales bacterium]